jgi:hypothetical protein
MLAACMLLTGRQAAGQEIGFERLIALQHVDFQDIALSATEMIPGLHARQQEDSLYALLAYWQERCIGPEPMVRFRILYQIETNTFSDLWYPDNITDLLEDFRILSLSEEFDALYYDYFLPGYLAIHPGFDGFTAELARSLQRFTDLQPIERYFLHHYAGEFGQARLLLETGTLEGTRLDSLYREQEALTGEGDARGPGAPPASGRTTIYDPAMDPVLSLYAGAWLPRGNLAAVGQHAQVGMTVGWLRDRTLLNVNFLAGFLRSREEYYVVIDNALYGTDYFMSVHLGGDIGLALVKTRRFLLAPLLGVGIEGFETVPPADQEDFGYSRFLISGNLNVGLEARVYESEAGYFGLQGRYHLVNYRNQRGTDLRGNVVTVGLVFGFGY